MERERERESERERERERESYAYRSKIVYGGVAPGNSVPPQIVKNVPARAKRLEDTMPIVVAKFRGTDGAKTCTPIDTNTHILIEEIIAGYAS